MTTFRVTGSVLHDTVSWVSRATPARPTAPVLSGILIDATGDHVKMSGFDYDTSMRADVDTFIAEPGRTLLSARLLAAVAKTLNRDIDVTITADPGTAHVKAARSEWQLPVLPVDDYPQLPNLGDPIGTIDAVALRRAISRVLPVLAKDQTIAALASVRIETDGDRMLLVGTDRFRLTAAELPWQPKTDTPVEVLLPGALLDGAARGIGDGTVTVSADDGGFALATDSRAVSGRQVGEQFPRWRALVPAPTDDYADVDRDRFLEVVDQAQALADATRGHLAALRFEFGEGEVAVSVSGEDRRAHAVGPAEVTGGPFALNLNGGYIRDAIIAAGTAKVRLHFSSPTKPMLVLADDDPSYTSIVMPVRDPAR